jgi:propanol-preferring alcohol dehydrogenase
MKAAVVRKLGQPLKLEEMPIPTPGAGEVLIKILTSGVCHTDLHAAAGDWAIKPVLPLIPGHEGTGIVASVGSGVHELKEGDRVGLAWLHDACGMCEYCITGWETLCEKQHNSGYSVNGSFAEYSLGAAAFVGRLPDKADMAVLAPILCAGVTTYKGIKETEARPGEWLAISGIGGLGHVAIQYAKAMGLQVIALDVSEKKLTHARALGADLAFDARAPDVVTRILRETGGGAHGVLATAVSRDSFAQAIQITRRKGTVALVGLPPGDFAVPIGAVVLKRITLRGSIVGNRQDLAEALDFAVDGRVHADISRTSLESINDVFRDLKDGRVEGRVVLDIATA